MEGRNRLGGRIHQERLPNGHFVDTGANWIHGTDDNPIMDLARETGTVTSEWDEESYLFDEDGELLPVADSTRYSTIMWTIISEAFKYSNEHGSDIDPSRTLLDFFRDRVPDHIPETEDDHARKKQIVLQLAEFWGAFVGSPVSKQSLKFFWLEECIDGGTSPCYFQHDRAREMTDTGAENLFVAGTYGEILQRIAQPAVAGAVIKYNTQVSEIHGKSSTGNDTVRLETVDGKLFEFDGVVLTMPLGWLKRNPQAFIPPLPAPLSRAVQNIGYGCLEKVSHPSWCSQQHFGRLRY